MVIYGNRCRSLIVFALAATICKFVNSETYNCVSTEFPPLTMEDQNGKASGFVVESVTIVFKNLGQNIHVGIYPLARALSMIKSEQSDCIF